jgi:hypothetical protein
MGGVDIARSGPRGESLRLSLYLTILIAHSQLDGGTAPRKGVTVGRHVMRTPQTLVTLTDTTKLPWRSLVLIVHHLAIEENEKSFECQRRCRRRTGEILYESVRALPTKVECMSFRGKTFLDVGRSMLKGNSRM